MGIYLFNLFSLPFYRAIIKKKCTFCILVVIQMFLILALRSVDVGVDLGMYMYAYQRFETYSFTELIRAVGLMPNSFGLNFEGGYVFLNWICSYIGLDFHDFLVLCAAINMISVGMFIYKYSNRPCLSFVIFAAIGDFFNCFFILRQMLAISIALWGVPFLLKNERWKTIILFFIAFLFHRSVLLLLPIVFLYNIKINKRMLRFFFGGSLIFLIVGRNIMEGIVFKIYRLFGVGHYIASYGFSFPKRLIPFFIIAIIAYLNFNDKRFNIKFMNLAIWVLLMNITVELIGMWGGNLLRGENWYTIFFAISLPSILVSHDKITKHILNVSIYGISAVYMIATLVRIGGTVSKGMQIVPYQMI